MKGMQFILDQVDAHLSIIIAMLWVTVLFTLCLVLLIVRNAKRLTTKVDATLQAVEKLKRSANNHRVREITASARRAQVEGHHERVAEGQAPGSRRQE